MSARFYVGSSPGGHALRIMKSATDNPATTLRTQFDKFAFDSESGNLGYAHTLSSLPYIDDMAYPPVVTSMVRYEADWWELQGGSIITENSYLSGSWVAIETLAAARVSRDNVSGAQSLFMSSISVTRGSGGQYGPSSPILEQRNLVWKLPGDSTPYPFPSSVGTISRFYRSGSQVRLPRPGYPINDPNVHNFILHEDMGPAKIVKSGRLDIPAGGTVDVQIPPEIGDNIVVGGCPGVPGYPLIIPQVIFDNTDLYRNVQVRFMGNGVLRFRELGGNAAYFVYFIAAENNSTLTHGTGSFLRSYGTGSEAYVQMCRPGASENPSISDVLLDSRWGTMPIIAEGWVPKSAFGGGSDNTLWNATVTFPDQGYVPLVFVNWVDVRNTSDVETGPGQAGYYVAFTTDGYAEGNSGYTRYAEVYSDGIVFRHAMGMIPAGVFDGINPISSGPLLSAFSGVRYYVFAVPQS